MRDFDNVTIELAGVLQKSGQSVAIHHVRPAYVMGVDGNRRQERQNSVLLWREGKARYLSPSINIKITTAQGDMLLDGWINCAHVAPIDTDEGVCLEVFPERYPT
jgi:hypothetical protein